MTAQTRDGFHCRLENVHPHAIVVPDNRRPVDQAAVRALAESIKLVGLRNSINVREGTHEAAPYTLISGAHRLEACKLLGINTIPCLVYPTDTDVLAAMAEIAENLHRHDLTPAQVTDAVMQWGNLAKEHEAAKEEKTSQRQGLENGTETKESNGGPNGPPSKQSSRRKGEKTGPDAGSARDLAAKTGRSESSIKRAKRRGTALGQDVINRVRGTSLDKGFELDALAKVPEAERATLVARAEAGEQVSAKAPRPTKSEPFRQNELAVQEAIRCVTREMRREQQPATASDGESHQDKLARAEKKRGAWRKLPQDEHIALLDTHYYKDKNDDALRELVAQTDLQHRAQLIADAVAERDDTDSDWRKQFKRCSLEGATPDDVAWAAEFISRVLRALGAPEGAHQV